ncbi:MULTISPECIES: DMT family transporter [Psychrilyobacter]|uniref:DMT family transporter n=1 Tax=Psychrilyobacter piezotolerans TaxID=2293438 RepID=A0ABX9KE76_9FUSO|nr:MULTISPECIES: DMT family transporter [Psychrilyobacter]MCS5421958.1 DMT family transporter [Psychrilyobacter sp. S5]NDI78847.1 DMT family transporter [Psychrilyobacter piezotolerans]RDE59447.1 DMT family transporter [Psychrilyobacter sp. S5]REI39917.1 DMT family transporter [Psychrilyobacter piezotolerans]
MNNELIGLNKSRMKELIDKNLMVIATLFFSGAFIAGKFSIAEFPVYSLTFFRFLIAAVVLFLIMWKKGEDLTLEKADIPRILLLSLLGMVGYHVFFFTALKYTSSVNTSLIAATNPIMTTIMASLFLKERFPKKAVGGILISFLGVAMIVTNGSIDVIKNMNFNIGDLYMLLAVLSFSLYFIVLKGIVGRVAPIKLTSYVFLFCVILLIPMVIYENPMSFIPKTTWTGWSSLVYMSIFASVIAYLIQQVSVKRIGPAKTSLYVNLVPLFSMIMAYFILGEVITLPKVFAGFMIITGVIITLRSKK